MDTEYEATTYASLPDAEQDFYKYWDPRYEAYFYRGVMPSPTGEEALQALYAVPTVEMFPTDDPGVPPILVNLDEEGLRTSPSTGNRITWRLSLLSEETEDWDIPCTVPVLSILAGSLSILTILVLIALWAGLNEQSKLQEPTLIEDIEELGPELARLAEVRYAPPYPDTNIWRACLVSDSVNSSVGQYDDKRDTHSMRAPCCEAVVICCCAVKQDLTVDAFPYTMDSRVMDESLLSAQCPGKDQSKMILGVRASSAVFSRLVNGNDSAVQWFLRSAMRYLIRFGFNGFALLLLDIPKHSKKSVEKFVRTISEGLRQYHYTLTLLLPYKAGHYSAHGDMLNALRKLLPVPYSFLFYPEVRMFGNVTLWPSPTVVGHPSLEEHGANANSVCYLFSKRPFLVALTHACEPRKSQPIADLKRQHSDDVSYICHLWNPSWESSAYKYNMYSCEGMTGILYQTRDQVLTFYEDLRSLVQPLCYGIIDGGSKYFPSLCLGK